MAGLKVAIVSLLKPVTDPRMLHKQAAGLSLRAEVHIIGAGQEGSVPPNKENIVLHPMGAVERGYMARLKRAWHTMKVLAQIKPQIIIFSAPDLLIPLMFYSAYRRVAIAYDVRENFAYNLLYQSVHAQWLRRPLAALVRAAEWASRLYTDVYLLAERTYLSETSFHKGRSILLENKFRCEGFSFRQRSYSKGQHLRLVYAGTVTRAYGTLSAIAFFRAFREQWPASELYVCGYCSDDAYLAEIDEAAYGQEGITLAISRQPVPYRTVLAALDRADLALLCYEPNKSTENCIPAKLYECLALGVPMLLPPNQLWLSLCRATNAALPVNYEQPDVAACVAHLAVWQPYPEGAWPQAGWHSNDDEYLWTQLAAVADKRKVSLKNI